MRWFRVILLSCLLVLFTNAFASAVFHDASGNAIHSSQLKGKWVIVNYWAAWCHSCVVETPELNHFYQNNQGKNVVLYGVNFDQLPPEELKHAINKLNIAYPVLQEDPAATMHLAGIDVLPTTFIINPKGKIVKEIIGPSTEQILLGYLHEVQGIAPDNANAT